MGLAEYEEALGLINEHPQLCGFVGPRNETLVQAAESKLGLTFAPSYRRFLLELGAGNFGACEVYGVIDTNFESSSVPDGVWCTLDMRKFGLPPDLFVVYHLGEGTYCCLDCRKSPEEGPIVAYHPVFKVPAGSREIIANNFGEFFLELVREELEFQGMSVG